jgi:hypothetical protein
MQNATTSRAEFAQQLADRISYEFNERLAAFLARAVQRRQATESRQRLDKTVLVAASA